VTIRERFNVWITSPDIRIGGHGHVDCFRAGYLAALEDAAKACEKLEIGPDSTGERTTQARYFDAACGNCAAAVRALGE